MSERIASLEERRGFEAISQNSAVLRDASTIDSILIRELINQAQARLARLAGLPGAYLADAGISLIWRQKLNTFGSEIDCIRYTTDTIAGLAGPTISPQTIQELSSPTSALRTAGDQAAHPEHPVFEALVARANDDQRPLLRELVSFLSQ